MRSHRAGRVQIGFAVVAAGTIALSLAGPAVAEPGLPSIRYGSTGIGVKCVQLALDVSGAANLTIDGKDGPKTTAAIRSFQHYSELHVDGIVGPKTGDALRFWWFDGIDGHNCWYYVPTTTTSPNG